MNRASNSPYQIGVAGEPSLAQPDPSSQLKNAKEDEQKAKSPLIAPDPIDKINPIFATIFVSLMQIKTMLNQAKQNPTVSSQKIEEIQEIIDQINVKIVDLPVAISKITL